MPRPTAFLPFSIISDGASRATRPLGARAAGEAAVLENVSASVEWLQSGQHSIPPRPGRGCEALMLALPPPAGEPTAGSSGLGACLGSPRLKDLADAGSCVDSHTARSGTSPHG